MQWITDSHFLFCYVVNYVGYLLYGYSWNVLALWKSGVFVRDKSLSAWPRCIIFHIYSLYVLVTWEVNKKIKNVFLKTGSCFFFLFPLCPNSYNFGVLGTDSLKMFCQAFKTLKMNFMIKMYSVCTSIFLAKSFFFLNFLFLNMKSGI